MSCRFCPRFWVVAAVLLVAAGVTAQPTIFKWIDPQGGLHATDRLGDVPEPYYSMYVARLRALEEQRSKAGGPPAATAPSVATEPVVAPVPVQAPPAAPSLVEQVRAKQARWKALVAHWRSELGDATTALEAVQNELAEAGLNPILSQTPEVKARIAELQERRDSAKVRLETARKMLLEELPAKARKEAVPLKWLE